MGVSRRYQRILDGYIRWSPDPANVLFRQEQVPWNTSAPSAGECMMQWESNGKVPVACSEPELLARYIQGKRSRDWHITEWRLGIKEGLFHWREFIGAFGLTEAEVREILPTGKWPWGAIR